MALLPVAGGRVLNVYVRDRGRVYQVAFYGFRAVRVVRLPLPARDEGDRTLQINGRRARALIRKGRKELARKTKS